MVWTLLLTASWLWTGYFVDLAFPVMRSSEAIFPIVWCYLIARIVHGESLSGTRQFWLSRPYRRSSLFVAKVMFVAAYLILPLATAQLVVLTVRGFPVGDGLAAVAWEQLLYVVIWVLPAMAIASLTTSLAQFIPAMLLVPVMLGVIDGANRWGRFSWISYTVGLSVGAAGAAVVVYLQFRHRRELVGRVLGLSAVLAAVACIAFLPWRTVFAVQSSLADVPGDAVAATMVRPEPRDTTPLGHTGTFQFRFELAGIPPDTPIVCHTGEMVVRRANGEIWRSGPKRMPSTGRAATLVEAGCPLWFATGTDLDVDEIVDVDVSLFMTVFGSPETTTFDVGSKPVPVAGAGTCYAVRNVVTVLSQRHTGVVATCVNAFRDAPRLVQLKASDRDVDFSEPQTYSPFPARLQLEPIERTAGAVLDDTDRVEVLTRSPVMHVQRTIRLEGIRLGDYELRLP
jgi:hypothetical protein